MQANYSITGAHAGDDQHPYTRNVPVGATIAETFENLLSSLKVQTYPLVSLYGSEEDARISPVKVDRHFHYDKFAGRIYGATNKEPMSPTQLSFDSMSSALSLNFYVTDMSENDLVYQIFGQDTTIKSCATATWDGNLPIANSVTINNRQGTTNNQTSIFSIEVNGVMYNGDKSQDITELNAPDLYSQIYIYRSSDGSINFSPMVTDTLYVRLSPSTAQKVYSNKILAGEGDIVEDGTFIFKLQAV